MLLKLSASGLRPLSETSTAPFVGRISECPTPPLDTHRSEILLAREPLDELPAGFRAYLLEKPGPSSGHRDVYVLGPDHRHLGQGDVIGVDPVRRRIRSLYRRSSPSNNFLVTERCDNYCLMCSQPPKEADDSWLVDELREVIPLISPDTRELGITGGEPALLGNQLTPVLA